MKMEMKKKGSPLTENEKKAKMHVVKAMRDMAEQAMGEKLNGLKKVTVASNDKEGLKAGLEKAKELIGQHSGDSVEEAEEETCEDLDHDMEEGEPESHKEAVMGDEYGMSPSGSDVAPGDEMTEEELNMKLQELMAKKAKLDARKGR